MEIFTTYSRQYGARDFTILTEDEWREAGLGNLIYYKQAHKRHISNMDTIDGIVTEDGYAIPVKRWILNYNFVTGADTVIGKVLFMKHKMNLAEWGELREAAKVKAQRVVAADVKFVKELVSTGDKVFAAKAAYGIKAGSDKFVERKLSKKGVRALLKKEVQEAADRVGVDRDFVLKRLKEISEKNNKNAITALKELVDIFELKGDKRSTNLNINATLPLSEEDVKALEEAKRHKLAEVTEAKVIE